MLKRSALGLAGFLGVRGLQARAIIFLTTTALSVVLGAFAYGYYKARMKCVLQDAEQALSAQENYAEDVKGASRIAINTTSDGVRRERFFAEQLEQIKEMIRENADSCTFSDDALRLLNDGTDSTKAAEGLRP